MDSVKKDCQRKTEALEATVLERMHRTQHWRGEERFGLGALGPRNSCKGKGREALGVEMIKVLVESRTACVGGIIEMPIDCSMWYVIILARHGKWTTLMKIQGTNPHICEVSGIAAM